MDSPASPSPSRSTTPYSSLGRVSASTSRSTAEPGSSPPARSRRGVALPLLGLLVLVAVPALLPTVAYRVQYALVKAKEQAQLDVASDALDGFDQTELADLFRLIPKRVQPSVVHINTSRAGSRAATTDDDEEKLSLDGLFSHEFLGQGSGVIVEAEGYILTSRHVVAGASQIEVVLSDRRALPARLVGSDQLSDLAVLKIEADDLAAAPWGDSDQLQTGSLVWAVGSPFGLDHTITFGIISATGRRGLTTNPYQDFLQTDAAVNPGNSGGPLVDVRGRVVGINTAIVGQSFQGISFAIPSHVAQEIFEKIRAHGNVARGWLGVRLETEPRRQIGDPAVPSPAGALVAGVLEDSPAAAMGLVVGDVVVKWNETPIETARDLGVAVAGSDVGSRATLEYLRDGQSQTAQVVVGRRPESIR